jgi:hypothetical protein
MADDDEARRLDPEAAVAPNRDRRGEPVIIEGEATAAEEAAAEATAASSEAAAEPSEVTAEPAKAAEEQAAPEPPPRVEEPVPAPPRRPSVFIAACVGGVVGALVAAGIVWFESSTAGSDVSQRLAATEAPINDLTRRVAALETSAQNTKSAAQSDAEAARSDAAKALALATKTASSLDQQAQAATSPAAPGADTSALEARIQKIESALSAGDKSTGDRPAVDLSPFENRLAKVEATLATPKSETRVAPEENHARRDEAAALAVAAEAIFERLGAGAPYAAEQSALERLGADTAKVAALKPFAERGAPTAAALASSFAKIAPDALKAAGSKESGGVMDRLMSNMSKVVKITPVGETAGDDPAAIVSQIVAALDRGRIDAAMALWARLPEPSRHASQDWANSAQARLAADAAAQDVLNDAMAKLASSEK